MGDQVKDQVFEAGIMADHQYMFCFGGRAAEHVHQGCRGGEVNLAVPLRIERQPAGSCKMFECFDDTLRRGGEDEIKAQSAALYKCAHDRSSALALVVQRPVKITGDRIIPAGFRMPQKCQFLHILPDLPRYLSSSETRFTEEPCPKDMSGGRLDIAVLDFAALMSASALSSVILSTGVPLGKADSRRDGKADERMTKWP